MRRALVLIAAVASLAACGSTETENDGRAESSSPAAAETSEAAEPAVPANAAAVVTQLQDAGLPISETLAITETNDPNNLIGRPGQYTSKVVFADERTGVPIDQTEPGNEAGGSVEFFADADGARARADYIAGVQASMGPMAGVEYHYLVGPALVRVTGELPPSVAAEYEAAVAGMQ